MFKKRLFVLSALLLVFLCECDDGSRKDIPQSDPRPLVVAIDVDVPGYFVVGGERYGYQYDLLKAYAEYCGRELEIVTGQSIPALKRSLRNGETDLIITRSCNVPKNRETQTLSLYTTTYVMLARSKDAATIKNKPSLKEMAGEKRLAVSSGFQGTQSYDTILDSLSRARIYVTAKNGFDLIGDLRNEQYDLLICEKGDASLGISLMQDICQVYQFDEEVPMSIMTDTENETLLADFSEWFNAFHDTDEFRMLNSIYFEGGFSGQLREIHKQNRVVGGISVWDDLIRRIGDREGVDWRLLSAIAYHESRFLSSAVSDRGAQGLMQIMPVVARHFHMENADLLNPEINITIAAKLIKTIDSQLDFDHDISSFDRTSIILAAYNGGIGHLTDARRTVASEGGDPDSWEEIAACLARMSDREYAAAAETIRCGVFRGSGETIAYANNVMTKYDEYRQAVTL